MSIIKAHVQPGEYRYFKVDIDGNDITNLVVSCDIYQDIFSPTWSARLSIIDAVNTQHVNSLNVGNNAVITVETDAPLPCGGPYSKTYNFVVQSVSNKILLKKTMYGYEFHLIAKEAVEDIKTRISKYYEQKAPETLVNNILSDAGLGSAETDADPTKYDVIIPNWTGFTAVNWVCQFAQIPGKGADFVFFQKDNGGQYKFKSVEKMFTEKSGYKFIHKAANYRQNTHKEDEDSFIKMQRYKFITELDGIKNMAMGFFGNTSIAHDIINKKIIETPYEYSQDNPQDKSKKPWKGSTFENAKDSSFAYRTLHDRLTPTAPSPHQTHDKWRGSRRSHQMKLETNKLLIEVPGSACLWDSLGKSVEVELPPQEDITNEKLDRYYKGDYLVLAIRHIIMDGHYKIVMELGKKRLETALR